MTTYHPKVRKNGIVQVGGYIWKHPLLIDHVGEKIEVTFNPVYPENEPVAHLKPHSCLLDRVVASGLETPHEINRAVRLSESGKGDRVFARMRNGDWIRIVSARVKDGELQVQSLSAGRWLTPTVVELERHMQQQLDEDTDNDYDFGYMQNRGAV